MIRSAVQFRSGATVCFALTSTGRFSFFAVVQQSMQRQVHRVGKSPCGGDVEHTPTGWSVAVARSRLDRAKPPLNAQVEWENCVWAKYTESISCSWSVLAVFDGTEVLSLGHKPQSWLRNGQVTMVPEPETDKQNNPSEQPNPTCAPEPLPL
jgi:hypothetical protein